MSQSRKHSLALQIKEQEILISQKENPTDDDYRLLRELRMSFYELTGEMANEKYES